MLMLYLLRKHMMTKTNLMFCMLIALNLIGTSLMADGDIVRILDESDLKRIERYEVDREAQMVSLRSSALRESETSLLRLLSADPQSVVTQFDPSGSWQCRFLKRNSNDGVSIYDWYSCRIYDDGLGWVLEKETGSERTRGRFYNFSDEQLLYLGAFHHANQIPSWYGQHPERNQIGFFYTIGGQTLRLEFLPPYDTEAIEVIELKR